MKARVVVVLALALAGCSAMNRMAEKANEPPKTAAEKVAEKYGPDGPAYPTQPAWYLSRYGEPDHKLQRETALGTRLIMSWNCADGEYVEVTWRARAVEDATYWEVLEKTTATGICE